MACYKLVSSGWDNRLTSHIWCRVLGQSDPLKPPQQPTSLAVAVRTQATVVAMSHWAQVGEKAGMCIQGPSLSLLGSLRMARPCWRQLLCETGTLQLTVTLHGTPWPTPAVPEVHLRFGVCSFVNVTSVFVSCLFFSWAKQHWETRTSDPLLKNQWRKLRLSYTTLN